VARFPRSSPTRFGAARLLSRRLALLLGSTATLSVGLLLAAVPAGAIVKTFASHEYGVEPQAGVATPATALGYHNGPVVHSNESYAIYWDPEDLGAAWQRLTAGFLEEAGRESGPSTLTNVNAVATQYRDTSGANAAYNSSFRGAYTDVDPFTSAENCALAAPCLSDAQIRTELAKYISANNLPVGLNPSTGQTPIYFVFTPPNTTVCLGEAAGTENCSKAGSAGQPLCSYHSFTTVNATTVLYAVIPATAITACQDNTGLLEEVNETPAEIIVNSVADEQVAAVTDPLLNGWHGVSGEEVPDKCRYNFLPLNISSNQIIFGVKYYLNDEFDQAALYDPYPGNACINTVIAAPRFTAPTAVTTGEPVTFNATESYVDLGIAKYHWEFGPGETAEVKCEGRTPTNGFAPSACTASSGTGNPNPAASVVHTYAHSGTYEVKLTVIDDGGHSAVVAHSITVVPTEAEERATREAEESAKRTAEESAKRSAEGKAKSTAEESAKRTAEAKASAVPAPVATAAVLSRSLKSVLASGLIVRYSVNEQVAGHFEVLLAASVARRIGLHGPPATGLAKGTAPQIVIAKAILVTTRGGRNTVDIRFGKETAKRLRRLGKVSLIVRLVVRNASPTSPASTTVLTVVNLSH
jgi:hypothetical protein